MKLTKNKNTGYTLVELLVGISIISILLFISLSKFDQEVRTQKVNSAVQQAVFAIKQAKHYSRTKGIKTQLIFNAGNTNYVIKAEEEIITNNTRFDATSGVLPEGTKIINNTCGNIYFYVDGTPVDSTGEAISNDCTITLGYSNNPQKTLTFKAVSGNINYEK